MMLQSKTCFHVRLALCVFSLCFCWPIFSFFFFFFAGDLLSKFWLTRPGKCPLLDRSMWRLHHFSSWHRDTYGRWLFSIWSSQSWFIFAFYTHTHTHIQPTKYLSLVTFRCWFVSIRLIHASRTICANWRLTRLQTTKTMRSTENEATIAPSRWPLIDLLDRPAVFVFVGSSGAKQKMRLSSKAEIPTQMYTFVLRRMRLHMY